MTEVETELEPERFFNVKKDLQDIAKYNKMLDYFLEKPKKY